MARLEIDFLNQFPMEKPEVSSLKVFDLFLIYFDLVFPVSLLYSGLRRTELRTISGTSKWRLRFGKYYSELLNHVSFGSPQIESLLGVGHFFNFVKMVGFGPHVFNYQNHFVRL